MSRTVESIKKTQDNMYKNITRNYVLLVLTVIVALALVLAIAGYVLRGGILPNAHKGSLITYPTEQQLSVQSSAPQSFSAVPQTSIDFGTLEARTYRNACDWRIGHSTKRVGGHYFHSEGARIYSKFICNC